MNAPGKCFVKVGDLLASKYRVDRILGSGGMGVVVAATHVDLQEVRAIKLMRPTELDNQQAVERFLREARAAVKLRSEHVAEVYDVGRLESGAPYIVMEFLEGRDLSFFTKKNQRLPVDQAVLYILQACDALAEAHAVGIIHRDLKPANLFLTIGPDGSRCIKVLDFGISKQSDCRCSADGEGEITGTADVMGSPLYMSPEQMRSSRLVDGRTDIWALGVILYRLLTARAPFWAANTPEVFAQVLDDKPVTPPSVWRPNLPKGLENVILRCIEKQLTARMPTVRQLMSALLPFGPLVSQPASEPSTNAARNGHATNSMRLGDSTHRGAPAAAEDGGVSDDDSEEDIETRVVTHAGILRQVKRVPRPDPPKAQANVEAQRPVALPPPLPRARSRSGQMPAVAQHHALQQPAAAPLAPEPAPPSTRFKDKARANGSALAEPVAISPAPPSTRFKDKARANGSALAEPAAPQPAPHSTPLPASSPAGPDSSRISTLMGIGLQASTSPGESHSRPWASSQPLFLLPAGEPSVAPRTSGLAKEEEPTSPTVASWNHSAPEPVKRRVGRGVVVGLSLAAWGVVFAFLIVFSLRGFLSIRGRLVAPKASAASVTMPTPVSSAPPVFADSAMARTPADPPPPAPSGVRPAASGTELHAIDKPPAAPTGAPIPRSATSATPQTPARTNPDNPFPGRR